GVHELICHTPIVEITRFSLPKGVSLFAKLEFYHPGGSVKDCLGIDLIEDALEKGLVTQGGIIIESTAGNNGIGLELPEL
ncbi:pyridoxal-phosphate dependent enzyme, partial [Bacillus cereus]|uniref:pyridoxal-phosphate dependent enzyme n=1 Tax=Bacillus cereus TaxID=1396 RepID=UPI00284116BE